MHVCMKSDWLSVTLPTMRIKAMRKQSDIRIAGKDCGSAKARSNPYGV